MPLRSNRVMFYLILSERQKFFDHAGRPVMTFRRCWCMIQVHKECASMFDALMLLYFFKSTEVSRFNKYFFQMTQMHDDETVQLLHVLLFKIDLYNMSYIVLFIARAESVNKLDCTNNNFDQGTIKAASRLSWPEHRDNSCNGF